MEKYRIGDLLLVCKSEYYEFAVLNEDRTKIKVIASDKILRNVSELRSGKGHFNGRDVSIYYYIVGMTQSMIAYPIITNGLKKNNITDILAEKNQLQEVLHANGLLERAEPIFNAVFGIKGDFFMNDNRYKFIDKRTIYNIQQAINTALTDKFNRKRKERLEKQRQQNEEDAKTFKDSLQF